ncbi:unnamed protein product [Gongylonema pulchrum]|uniref:Uncharacterized protein n=1 Tax=Gongylonema pulchrum TaxID=637853 RepID=A0A183ETM8_9BILA|nr:unnamed protein product [Gongylonema pulchrum]
MLRNSLLERRGALIDCQSTKDTFIYASSCRVDGFGDIIKMIADAVQRPVIKEDDVQHPAALRKLFILAVCGVVLFVQFFKSTPGSLQL